MALHAIALWFKTPNEEAFLQKRYFQEYKAEVVQPFKTWKRDYESPQGTVHRLLQEELGGEFSEKLFRLHLSFIKSEPFVTNGGREAIRHHFICELPFQPLLSSKESVILVSKEDAPKIKKISDRNKNPEDIILFDFDQQTLLEILGVQATLIPW